MTNKQELEIKSDKSPNYAYALAGPSYQSTEKVKQKELEHDAQELETDDIEVEYTS